MRRSAAARRTCARGVRSALKFLLSPGARICTRAYIGWDAFRQDWENFLAAYQGPITYNMVDLDVDADGTLGYVHVTEHIVDTNSEGKSVEINMRVTELYRKINGKWLIEHETRLGSGRSEDRRGRSTIEVTGSIYLP
ncbi:MAG: YybH family protein [Candidatus Binataceae bacterium]